MSMTSCKNCDNSINTHHNPFLTCCGCGMPYHCTVTIVGKMDPEAQVGLKLISSHTPGSMYHISRLVELNGHVLMTDGKKTFLNKKNELFVLGDG